VFGADLLNDPPAAAVGQLRLDQREMWSLVTGSIEGRLVGVCLGHDAEPVERA